MNLPDGMISSYVNLNGIKTHYVEAGNGFPLVLVHGSGPGATGYLGFQQAIPELAKHFHVYALDLIGFGYTDKPTNIVYSDQRFIKHLSDFIDAMCIDKVLLLGNSKGAYACAKYACDNPDRVQAVMMVSSGSIAAAMGIERTPEEMAGMHALDAFDGTREGLRKFMEFIVSDHAKITDELLDARLALSALPGHDYSRKSAGAYRKSLKSDPNQQQLFDLEHRLPKLTVPMYMVWGAKDSFAPPGFSERLVAKLPNVTFEMFENSGHQVQNDECDRFNETTVRFFKKHL